MPKFYLYLCLLSFFCLVARAQQAETSIPIFFEKAYLHTDRDIYTQGEDIWFKAYIVNAQANELINYSHNLYIDLIGPDAKVVARRLIRLDGGLGNGDFKLADTVALGTYRIRAYTNWMRNFGDQFIFEKTISILSNGSFKPIAVVARNSNNVPAKPNGSVKADIIGSPQVRFFPEGGSMVNGVTSVIAVKAEDENGNGIAASGEVVNTREETIAKFMCDSLGMGSFLLQPVAGQQYKAIVMIKARRTEFKLPQAYATGFNMAVKLEKPLVNITINCNEPTIRKEAGRSIYVIARHAGKTYYRSVAILNSTRTVVTIQDDVLPEGVTCITVMDEQNKPLCERLIYIHHLGDVQLAVSPDKPQYQPKEKITLKIKLNRNEVANLSLAAVNEGMVPVPAGNILTYLNLQSEVKGRIAQPGRYFYTTNTNRFKQLDLLLLTQGWRDFVWKRIADTTLNITYDAEQGITLTGMVRAVGRNKPLPNIHIAVHAPNAVEKFFEARTDSAGKFAIYGTHFYGYQYFFFNARDYTKKAGKSDSGGWLKVDSLVRDTLPVRPAKQFAADTLPSIAEALLKLKIPKDRQLQEVQIKAKASTKFPSQVHNITLAEQKEYSTIREYLLANIPGSHMVVVDDQLILADGNIPWNRISVSPHYADGSKINKSTLRFVDPADLTINKAISITINKYVTMKGFVTYSAILKLRPNVLETADYFDDTMADMVGYNRARIFYSPKFDNPDERIDQRTNTIHWQPNIVTDNNGEATVSFYNTVQTGKIKVVVQGVTHSGVPVVSNTVYSVK
jgi:hypothetical protein